MTTRFVVWWRDSRSRLGCARATRRGRGALDTADPAALPGALSALAREVDHPITVVADALDEAVGPAVLCRLLRSCSSSGVRVLVGVWPHLADRLGDAEPLHLDEAPWLEPGDIAGYVSQLLDAGAVRSDPRLIADIERAAAGDFLVAQLSAQAVAASGGRLQHLPTSVRDAFEAYLEALDDPRVRDLLLPLAYAFGMAFPVTSYGSWPCSGYADGTPRGTSTTSSPARAAPFLLCAPPGRRPPGTASFTRP
jgi:hypothetical protein